MLQREKATWSLHRRRFLATALLLGSLATAVFWASAGLCLAQATGNAAPAGLESHRKGHGLVASTARSSAALLCWSLFALVWFVSVSAPGAFVWALARSRGKVAAAILSWFLFPQVVTLPSAPSAVRHVFWHGLAGWFPDGVAVSGLPAETEPEPEPEGGGERRRLLYCVHPHGIYTIGAVALTDHVPEVRLCIAPFLYYCAPAFRIFADILGIKLGSSGPRGLRNLMRSEDSPLALVPGGFEEATVTTQGAERVYLKTRAGFVKYALRHGYDLVPCYAAGESDMFDNPQGLWGLRWGLNQLSIPAVLPLGFPLFPLLPRRVPVKLSIGPPLKMPHIENPSKADVRKHHARYVEALQRTFQDAARGTASEGRTLEIW